MAQQRGKWPVVAVNAVVAVSVLALVAVLALVVKPPAPPGIAAFAPQAAKPITKAPPGQSSAFGAGTGACAQGQVCTGTPSASPASALVPSIGPSQAPADRGVPSALQCFTWPDGSVTQTFDPQSPPCVATWDDRKGNGGSTSPGVTGTEIRVALPVNSTSSTWPYLKPLVDFFNTRFQLYGRRLTIVPFPSQQADQQSTGIWNDPATQRADASQITQLKVFASTDFVDPYHYSWSLPVFRDVLTKKKIISLAGGETTPYGTASEMAKKQPYEWTYYPTIDTVMDNVATMTCRQLVGRPATHAPDAQLRTKTRKFAVLIPTDKALGGPLPGLSSLLSILDRCGVHSPDVVRYDTAAPESQPGLAAKFRQLAGDGVTSMVFFPRGGDSSSSPLSTAAQAGFRPEWVFIGWNKYLSDFMLNSPQTETSGAFGVGTWNKIPPLAEEKWAQAYVAAGGDPSALSSGNVLSGRAFYAELLLLASGIQMAGPHLTPQTFADGLRGTTFPNPGAGSAPFYQASVGIQPGDVALVHGFNEFWLDTRVTGAEALNSPNLNNYRANCYVALGRRWDLDSWPSTDGFYQGGCR